MTETQKIYDIIRQAGAIARVDIANKYCKRPATVTRITGQLLKRNLICSCGKDLQGRGRSPELLKINPDAFHVLGLHVVTDGFRGGVVSSGGNMIFGSTLNAEHTHTSRGFLAGLKNAVRHFMDFARENGISIAGIGLALPGEVDPLTGQLVQAAVILPELTAIPCKQFLEDNFHLPVAVDHDGVMMTFGEYQWGGRAAGMSSLGNLFIGHGIGGRFIINGELFRGARNRAGEIGHICLRRNGPECRCGLHGCFEALASVPVIERNYGNNVCFIEIVRRAEAGEKRALDVLQEVADYMGEAVAMIFDILDVDLLVISGDIVAAKNVIRTPLLTSVTRHSHSKQPLNKEFLAFSNFGSEAGAVGAAAGIAKKVFADFGIAIK